MDNRLLSEQEIKDAYKKVAGLCSPAVSPVAVWSIVKQEELLKAQDTKTSAIVNAEWVAWGESKCLDYAEPINKRECYDCWQERKRKWGYES